MAGCKLIAMSGIDGAFSLFNTQFSSLVTDATLISYDRTASPDYNTQIVNHAIEAIDSDVIILGWSIGAAIAFTCSSNSRVKGVISINCFADRAEALKPRGIAINDEENINVLSYPLINKSMLIIGGERDDKISVNNSKRIFDSYRNTNNAELLIDSVMSHSLDTISEGTKLRIYSFIKEV